MSKEFVGITKQINNVAEAKANIDYKYGPYNSLEEAKAKLPMKVRTIGLTVGVKDGNNIVEYWFNGGIDNIKLIQKQTGKQGISGDSYIPVFSDDISDI